MQRQLGSSDKNQQRACTDVRRGHDQIYQWLGGGSAPAPRGGREKGTHAVILRAQILSALQVVAAGGALTHDRRQTSTQKLGLRLLFTTWSHPPKRLVLSGGIARERESELLEDFGARGAADWLEFFDHHPPALLENVRTQHPVYGEMDAYQWAKYLRIYCRSLELQA